MSSEAITRNDLTNILNDVLPSVAVDYIVEQGTSNDWTYRKWNNGVAECWGTYSDTISHAGTVFGGYAYNVSVNFPTGLFIDLPVIVYSAYLGNAYALTGTINNNFSTSSVNLYAVCNTSGSKSTVWRVTAKGRWK